MLYILGALRHNNIKLGLLPGRSRKDIQQQPNVFFRLRIEMLNVLYIFEALRHNNIMPGLLPGRRGKDKEQQSNFFFSAKDRKAKRVLYARSAQA